LADVQIVQRRQAPSSTTAPGAFDAIWVPRIGRSATAELRRNGYLTLVVGPSLLPLSILSSLAFSDGNEGLGCLGLALAITGCIVWTRSRLRFTAALSEWYGVKLGWYELPKMRTKRFEAWCIRRGLPEDRQDDSRVDDQ
jgi:hypothetical protein